MDGQRRIRVGRIVGVHGVQGWFKLESDTVPRRNIFRYLPWFVQHRGEQTRIDHVEGREQGKGLVAHWPGLQERAQAEQWIGAEIWTAREALPPPAPDEYYWVELEGLRVIGADGFEFGRVSHLFSTGANDVMAVSGERERLIPFLKDTVIRRIDLDAGLIEVDWDPEF